jgi:hypothetical protein
MTNENFNYHNCILRLAHSEEDDWVEFIPLKNVKCIHQRRNKNNHKIEYVVHYNTDEKVSFGDKISLIFLNDLNHEEQK